MRTKINLPKAGMGIDEATVLRWLKKVGESVTKNEVLVEVETAKALQEITAPVSGFLAEILVGPGETTAVNTALGYLEDEKG
jgi:pyruvate/2-oxoglutarate dehydrogenase complex dihydrolipoamide acyltransferase (E2) component